MVESFGNLVLASGFLTGFILMLVEFFKQWGVTGKWNLLVAMVLGQVLGIGYRVAAYGLPADFGEWFVVVLFGLAMGGSASGLYEFTDKRLPSLKQ